MATRAQQSFQSLEVVRQGVSNHWKFSCAVALGLAAIMPAGAQWKVNEATVKIAATVNGSPSPQEAGVIAIIPDGGVLPHPAEAVVFDSSGTELKSETVWANAREGFAVAFEAPRTGSEVSIYIKAGGGGKKKDSPLKPGLMLFTQVGGASLEKAEQIAKQSPPGRDARLGLVGRIGQRENLLGNDDDYASCYVGWLNVPKDEKIFFCTVSDEGSSFAIDGKTVASWPGLHKRDGGASGQYGDEVNLTAGFHKVEYFHFDKNGPQEANFCWRTGNDPSTAKVPNTVPEKFFTHSATASITDARYKDGRAVPMFSWNAVSYLWLTDKALCLYRLSLERADDMPRNAKFSWRIGEFESDEKEIYWIVPGDGEQTVELRVAQDGKNAAAARPIYLPATPRNASPNSGNDRRDYRQALLHRCLATPKGRSPCASWTADMWGVLQNVVEPYAGNALLEQIFERGRPDVQRRPPEERWLLEDIYIENMRYAAPSNVLASIEKMEQSETDAARRSLWAKRRFQFYLYDLDDPAKARATADAMRRTGGTPDQLALALICAGDLERMGGNFEQAQKLYLDAADRYRKRAVKAAVPGAGAPPAGEADWRIGAVRTATYARDVDNRIAQSDWLGARRELDKWEREFPFSKINGEFSVCDARYYFKIKDYKRAERILAPYVLSTDNAPELPDALQMRFECLMQLEKKGEAAELAADLEKRFPGHPVVEYVVNRAPADLLKKARELKAAPPKALP